MKFKTTAEHLVYLLGAHGIEYLFLNPGTDTAPVQEAVFALAEDGLPASVQLVGRPGADALVLGAGLALEAALAV